MDPPIAAIDPSLEDSFDATNFFLGTSNIEHGESIPATRSILHHASYVNNTFDSPLCRTSPVPGSSDESHTSQEEAPSLAFTNKLSSADSMDLHNWIALGSIRLFHNSADDTDKPWQMRSPNHTADFPGKALQTAHHRRLIHLQLIGHRRRNDRAVARVYVLPEDVDRGARGFIKDLRPLIKRLLTVVDTSIATFGGDFDDSTNFKLYGVPSANEDESLFYIFNTLDSPQANYDQLPGSASAQASMSDVLDDSIQGVRTKLYPYQKRSVAAMLKREENPTRSQDQRKPQYRDLTGHSFYMDVYDGIVLKNSQLYIEPQGGILAETMGYGKTLACIALILATRGQYPKVPEGRLEATTRKKYDKVPSLLTMAARSLKQAGMPWKAEFHAMKLAGDHYDRCLEELQKYEREFAEPIFHPTTPGRRVSAREAERTLRLCYATLVIVPPNLLSQWQQEIKKHTEPGSLDVLSIDMSTKQIPVWKDLMKYDIVLITKNRLDQEYRDDDLHQGRRFRGEDRYHSPLTDVRWFRVICDEGHAFAGSSAKTHVMAMLEKMSFERRWIISGTPSSSLHGVEVNLAAGESQTERRRESLDVALRQRQKLDSAEQETKDMDRLRLIVTNFLKLQPWANQKGVDRPNWNKYFAPFDGSGKRRCAPGLRSLLQSLMVRHRIEDIDVDLTLPPLHNKTVYLEPSYYDKLAINLFLLVLTSNAVTSERTDEDYMFHSKNRRQLDVLISNLRQSSFHWVGFTEHDIRETLRVSNKYLDDHVDNISDRDGMLLTEAIMSGERALEDPGWRAFSTLHEIGVYVDNFPEHAASAWSLHEQPSKPLLMGTVQARQAQQHVQKHILSEDPTSGLVGAGLRAMNDARKRADEESKSKKPSSTSQPSNTPAGITEEPKLKPSTPTSSSTFLKRPRSSSSSTSASTLNQLSHPTILGFTSAKLTYLCTRLLTLHHTEKTIIFYDFPNIAFWIAEALELLSIPFLIYANTLPPATRAKYLSLFNNTSGPRVLLMDLKQASHGLHVAAASRVFIVTPIWSPGVEAQAIKRAHRIGQTREVWVETLVLRGTIEERMWRRRKGLGERELRGMEKVGWTGDEGVREIIQGEGFQRFASGEGVEGERVPRLERAERLFLRERREVGDGVVDAGSGDVGEGGLVKKRKKEGKSVSFGKVTKVNSVRFGEKDMDTEVAMTDSATTSLFGGQERSQKVVVMNVPQREGS